MVRVTLKRREHYVIVATLFIAKYKTKYNIRRVIRICRSMKEKHHNGQTKKYKSTKTIYKTLQLKLEIAEPTQNRVVETLSSSWSTSGTCRFTLAINPGISHEWVKDPVVSMTSGTYPWSFVTQKFHNGQPSDDFSLTSRNSSCIVSSNLLARKSW